MFDRFFHSKAATTGDPAPDRRAVTSAGDTATVRRIVSKLEAMPPERARLIASAAYTLARAANADLDISDEETAAIERELQAHESIDEATAVLVTEMAKLQAKTVGGTEDFVVTREFHIRGSLGTGLDSKVVQSANNQVIIPINQPTDEKSQVQEYVNRHRGQGVQHIAVSTNDIFGAVLQLLTCPMERERFFD